MNIRDAIDSLDYLFKAQLTPFFWGRAGIGKSSIVKQYAESKGYHFFPFYLGTQSDLGDILGLQEFVRDESGRATSVTFAIPEWLHNTIKYCEENPDSGAVIFLDEFNRGRRDILNGMFSLALDKTFHTVKLPKNCHIVAAGNPPTDDYVTTDVNETALMARFVHIKLDPTVQEWLDYAKGRGIDNTLIEFVRSQPDLLEERRQDFDLSSMVKPDRRAFERLSRLFALKTPQHILEQLMYGIIGLERTVAYQQFLKEQDKPLTAQEVLSHQKFNLIEKWSNEADVQAACLNLTCENVETYMKSHDKEMLSPEQKANLMHFIEVVPKDIAFKLLLAVRQLPIFHTMRDDPTYTEKLKAVARSVRGIQ